MTSTSKKILMIHEVYDWMLDLDLSNYILTFDDGLFSQYKNLHHFLNFETPKIFFISTGIVASENEKQNIDIIKCSEAHKRYFEKGDLSNYMKWSQIIEIANKSNCFIGGHSHGHRDLRDNIGIKELHNFLKKDTSLMIETFKAHNLEITDFCFPYNYEAPLYKEILKQSGVTCFYGSNRIAIEDLKNAV